MRLTKFRNRGADWRRAVRLAALMMFAGSAMHGVSLRAATDHAWAGNAGWIDFTPSTAPGVWAAPGVLGGYAYAPNFGWIHFGDGSPADGKRYANTSASDYGVNHNGTGELSGYAYSPNIGWINFSWADPSDPNRPRVDLITGRASGYAYSGNIGWINLEELVIPGVTAQLALPGAGTTAGSQAVLAVVVYSEEDLEYTWLHNGVPIPGATGRTLVYPSLQGFHGGDYQVRIRRPDGTTIDLPVATLDVPRPPASGARLLNLSTRGKILGGDEVLIPGFVVAGADSQPLIIRTVGPRLLKFGVGDAIADPRMTVRRLIGNESFEVAANDNWRDGNDVEALRARFASVGAFDFEDSVLDAALDLSLSPGSYSVIADGVGGGTGVALVELYDAADAATSRLINISIRAVSGSGEDAIIPGFTISEEGPLTLLMRAVGPGLTEYGVEGVLSDPTITVFSGGEPLFENDNWEDIQNGVPVAEAAGQVGAFQLEAGSRDAAMLLTLAPGPYTVQVKGAAGETGVVLFELYEVE